jgi:protein-S-isoprenylcysteine O-methyltransferase Ste14
VASEQWPVVSFPILIIKKMTALKTLLFTIVIELGLVTIGIPYMLLRQTQLFTFNLGSLRMAGLLLMAAGFTIYLICAWDFTVHGKGTPAPIDPPKMLVARGFYKFTRNPMYVGVVTMIAGEAVFFESGNILLYSLVVSLAFHLRVIYYEEPTLRKLFGQSYEEYCRSVPRWFLKLM